jgi:hypothetical protein
MVAVACSCETLLEVLAVSVVDSMFAVVGALLLSRVGCSAGMVLVASSEFWVVLEATLWFGFAFFCAWDAFAFWSRAMMRFLLYLFFWRE